MSKLRQTAAYLAIALTVACENRYAIRFDSGTTAEQIELVRERAERWNQVTDSKHRYTFDQKRGGLLFTFVPILILSDGKEYGGRACNTKDLPDCAKAHWIRVSLALLLENPEKFKKAILHELGHGLNLKHTTDPNGVMKSGSMQQTIQESDKEECRRVGSCE